MTLEFDVERNPEHSLLERVAALNSVNPFCTPEYVATRRSLGADVVILSLQQNGTLTTACPAFIRSGRLNRTLEITSLPDVPDGEAFWTGLQEYCKRDGITYLEIGSFGSSAARIPAIRDEVARTTRVEYALDLQVGELWTQLRRDRRSDLKRARALGVQVRCTTDDTVCHAHVSMIASSMERRLARGENVPTELPLAMCEALLRHGVGTLFQAVLDGQVIASGLIARAADGAYYQSAGASARGRECGASTFLLFEASQILKGEGCKLFNLGGAGPEERGLHEFKSAFGARPVALEAATFFLGSSIRRKIETAFRFVRSVRRWPEKGASLPT